MTYRIVFAMEVFVEAETEESARDRFQNHVDLTGAKFCYELSIEQQETRDDISRSTRQIKDNEGSRP